MAEGDTVVNAVVGALVSVVLSGAVPFAPLVGGGVSGYLQGGSRDDGLRVGALSGVLAFVPALVAGVFVFGFFLTVLVGGSMMGPRGVMGPGLFGGLGLFGLVVVGLVGVGYFVGLGAVGGWLGNYVKYDTEFEV